MKTKVNLKLEPELLALSRKNKVNLSQLLAQSLRAQMPDPQYKPETYRRTIYLAQSADTQSINKALRYYLNRHLELYKNVVSDEEYESFDCRKSYEGTFEGEPFTLVLNEDMYRILRTENISEIVDKALTEYKKPSIENLILESYRQ